MNEDSEQKSIASRLDAYLAERRRILALPPEKILDQIVEHSRPEALVRSFPEGDFYFLIHDIGPADSLPLLAMASDAQWEFILDQESWQRDRLDLAALTKWFGLLLKASPSRLAGWFLREKTELLEFYLFKNLEVIVREHDQDPSEFGKDFITFDDIYYVRIKGAPPDGLQNLEEKMRSDVLPLLLERLADLDYLGFQRILLESRSLIPAESEEEAYRLRNVRLAEKGFLPFEEALGVYQHLSPENLRNRTAKALGPAGAGPEPLPAPLYPARMIEGADLFTTSLKVIGDAEMLLQLQTEFAGLCNRIAAADQKKIQDREELKNVVKKACGYLSIGLSRLIGPKVQPADEQRKEMGAGLLRFPLQDIFRVGYGSALELKWRAEKWYKHSWFKAAGLPLSFWGEAWMGVLGGLLVKRPLFYDNIRSELLYREFNSAEDLAATGKVLDAIIAFDDLLARMDLKIEPFAAYTLLNHKNLILTLWVRHHLKLAEGLRPLALTEFRSVFETLWKGEDPPRRVRSSVKSAFVNWLAEATGLGGAEIAAGLGQVLEALFAEIESEYGYVSSRDLDPKYIHLFLLSGGKEDA